MIKTLRNNKNTDGKGGMKDVSAVDSIKAQQDFKKCV
jgi:hypothetical protein